MLIVEQVMEMHFLHIKNHLFIWFGIFIFFLQSLLLCYSADTWEVSPMKDFFDIEFNKCIEIKGKHFILHHARFSH